MTITVTMDLEDWEMIETGLALAAETYADGAQKLASSGLADAVAASSAQYRRYRDLEAAIRRHIEPARSSSR